jgi:predicted DNA-binding transcriptional regulator AlpA
MRPKQNARTNLGRIAPTTDHQNPAEPALAPAFTEPLLTDDEAADLLALSTATLKKWRRTHYGPRYHKLGSAVRYSRGDLLAYIRRSEVNPPTGRHDENSER